MIRTRTVIFGMLLLSCTLAFAQTDSTTNGGGAWNAASTWKSGNVPTGAGTIVIRTNDSVYFNANITITGTLRSFSIKNSFDTSKTITFGATGIYDHAANGGSIPKATWSTGSTCLITGAIGNAPSNGSQNFYNLTWDCLGQTGGLNLGMSGNTILGNVRVIHSNKQYFRLTASNIVAVNKTITINGDCLIDDSTGQLTSTGSSGADTFTVITKGSIISYGTFNVANGSGASVNWYVGGDVKALGGAFSTNSTTSRPDSLIFNGTTIQKLARATSSMSNIQFAIRKGSTISFDTSSLGGSVNTTFTLEAGATAMTGHAKGLQGNLNNGGPLSLSTDANYVYNGVVAQMDSIMPTTVKNLTINNPAGVKLVNPTTINGILKLSAGVFDNTVPFTLGPSGSVQFAGGSLKITAVEPTDASTIPQTFRVSQNYPNPFNPSTMITYGLPARSYVTVKVFNVLGEEIATLFSGTENAGMHTLKFDASSLSTGVYVYRVQAGNSVEARRMVLIK